MSRRRMLANLATRSGVLRAIEAMPTRDGVLIVNHHRVGDKNACVYDRGVFAASTELFAEQVAYIKRNHPTILPRELAEMWASGKRLRRMHAMITFDDGYADNYEVAFPILKNHGVSAVFFLITSYVGTPATSWWDEIAYLVRMTNKDTLVFHAPVEVTLPLHDRDAAIKQVLGLYKSPQNQEPEAFLARLREQTEVTLPSGTRNFMGWEQATEMAANGMEIGSHTHTHRILSKLSPDEQFEELTTSKRVLEEHLGSEVVSLAYPRGKRDAFDRTTEEMARRAGYKIAFSFDGGVNGPSKAHSMFDVKRIEPRSESAMFRLEVAMLSRGIAI